MRQKGFYYNFSWVGFLFLVLGLLFLIPAIGIQIMTIKESNFNLTINGVAQPYTPENVQKIRWLFLAIFGSFSLILLIISVVFIARNQFEKKQKEQLKQTGTLIMADVMECKYSSVRVNHRSALQLICSYKNKQGEIFLFKSTSLRMDPTPYLENRKVNVYWDPQNKKKYFIDIDGSVGDVYEM